MVSSTSSESKQDSQDGPTCSHITPWAQKLGQPPTHLRHSQGSLHKVSYVLYLTVKADSLSTKLYSQIACSCVHTVSSILMIEDLNKYKVHLILYSRKLGNGLTALGMPTFPCQQYSLRSGTGQQQLYNLATNSLSINKLMQSYETIFVCSLFRTFAQSAKSSWQVILRSWKTRPLS